MDPRYAPAFMHSECQVYINLSSIVKVSKGLTASPHGIK